MPAPKTDGTGQIVPKKKEDTVAHLIKKLEPGLVRALPRHVQPDRMLRIVVTALRTTPKLLECTEESFLGSVMMAAQLGLEPNTPLGQCSLIPFRNNKRNCTDCVLIIGYQGMMDIARRSKEVDAIQAYVVREGDDFSWNLGLKPDIHHVPSEDENRESMPITHAYAVANMKSGPPAFVVLNLAEIEKYRARSRAAKDGPWVTDYEAMCKKTAVRRLYTWLPKSAEMATAAAIDEAPEIGKPQTYAYTPEVTEYILMEGGEIKEPEAEPEPEPEPEQPKKKRGRKSNKEIDEEKRNQVATLVMQIAKFDPAEGVNWIAVLTDDGDGNHVETLEEIPADRLDEIHTKAKERLNKLLDAHAKAQEQAGQTSLA